MISLKRSTGREPQKIAENFSRRLAALHTERAELVSGDHGLIYLHGVFNRDFTEDFSMGTEQMDAYREAMEKLKNFEVVRYEEKVRTTTISISPLTSGRKGCTG